MHKSSACGPGSADQCICGPSGTGKSHFCEALDQLANDTGRTVAWFSIGELGALVRRHRADDSINNAIDTSSEST